MDNVQLVQLADANDDLGNVELDVWLGKLAVLSQKLVHVAAWDMRHDEIKAEGCLEEVLHATQKRVMGFEEYLLFV